MTVECRSVTSYDIGTFKSLKNMGDKGLQVDNEIHELKLGSSFDPKSKVAFHSIRYDFKPASVDTTQDSLVEVGEGHQITVTVPHVEGAGTDHTVYKGNKRPCLKECVLIIDHQTGTFTLEKLTNNIQLKKTRIEGSSRVSMGGRPLTPVDIIKQKNSPVKQKNQPPQISPPSHTNSPSVTPVNLPQDDSSRDACLFGDISDDSSSYASSSDSDSDSEDKQIKSSQEKLPQGNSLFKPLPPPAVKPANTRPHFASTLSEDLRLSETSSSDSDDD